MQFANPHCELYGECLNMDSGYDSVIMDRRQFLRLTAGSAGIGVSASTAGCFGLFDNGGGGSDDEGPVVRPDSGDELPPEVEETVTDIRAAQSKIEGVITDVRDVVDSFNGIITGEELSIPINDLRDRNTTAADRLESARNGATERQVLMIEALETVVGGMESLVASVEALAASITAFNEWEAGIEEMELEAVNDEQDAFSSNVSTAYDSMGESRSSFTDVPRPVVESIGDVTVGQVERLYADLSQGVTYLQTMDAGMVEVVDAFEAIESLNEEIEEDGSLSAYDTALETVETAFQAAFDAFEGEGEQLVVSYRQDIAAMECVTGVMTEGASQYRTAIEAEQSGDQSEKVVAVMTAEEQLDSCSYGLADGAFAPLRDELLNGEE